jgi:hypothetical protein
MDQHPGRCTFVEAVALQVARAFADGDPDQRQRVIRAGLCRKRVCPSVIRFGWHCPRCIIEARKWASWTPR